MNPTRKVLDKPTRHLHREARFADPPWTRDRDQAHILTQAAVLWRQLLPFSPHKPGPLHRNICRAGLHLHNWFLREAVAYGCKFPCEISGRDVTLIGLFRQDTSRLPQHSGGGGVGILHSDWFGLFPENGH